MLNVRYTFTAKKTPFHAFFVHVYTNYVSEFPPPPLKSFCKASYRSSQALSELPRFYAGNLESHKKNPILSAWKVVENVKCLEVTEYNYIL